MHQNQTSWRPRGLGVHEISGTRRVLSEQGVPVVLMAGLY
jgi:hypothetical protein